MPEGIRAPVATPPPNATASFAVQLAHHVCDRADAGEILVSNVVRELAAGKGFLFAETGGVVLKSFEDPVRLFEVRWGREDA